MPLFYFQWKKDFKHSVIEYRCDSEHGSKPALPIRLLQDNPVFHSTPFSLVTDVAWNESDGTIQRRTERIIRQDEKVRIVGSKTSIIRLLTSDAEGIRVWLEARVPHFWPTGQTAGVSEFFTSR